MSESGDAQHDVPHPAGKASGHVSTKPTKRQSWLKRRSGVRFKLRAVFLPYLLVASCVLLGCSCFHWLLLSVTAAPLLDDTLVEFVLPIALPWFPIVFWLRHRVKLLSWPRDDPSFGSFIAWFSISIPTIIAQIYLTTAVGTLTHLEHISQIESKPWTRYYSIANLAFAKADARHSIRTWSSGRNSENWNMAVIYAIPLTDSSAGPNPNVLSAWLEQTYSKQVSNRLTLEDRHTQLDAFIRGAAQALAADDFRWISYFAMAGNNAERRTLEKSIEDDALRPSSSIKAPILVGVRGSFESRNGHKLAWTVASFGIAGAIWLLLTLLVRVNAAARRNWANSMSAPNQDLRVVYAFFIPRRSFLATPLLLDLNVAVWAVMIVCGAGFDSISAGELLRWGAVLRENVQAGEVWRLITSLFVHVNLLHFANNMVALTVVGFLVEGAFGSGWFAGVYLVTGLLSGMAGLAWHPLIVSAGASGSIFGVAGFGLTLLLLNRKRFSNERPLLLKIAAVYLGLNLVAGAVIPGIDQVGHVAGLASGVIFGLLASPFITDPTASRAGGRLPPISRTNQ
jgi:membrane associated rhomboid family serine protease